MSSWIDEVWGQLTVYPWTLAFCVVIAAASGLTVGGRALYVRNNLREKQRNEERYFAYRQRRQALRTRVEARKAEYSKEARFAHSAEEPWVDLSGKVVEITWQKGRNPEDYDRVDSDYRLYYYGIVHPSEHQHSKLSLRYFQELKTAPTDPGVLQEYVRADVSEEIAHYGSHEVKGLPKGPRVAWKHLLRHHGLRLWTIAHELDTEDVVECVKRQYGRAVQKSSVQEHYRGIDPQVLQQVVAGLEGVDARCYYSRKSLGKDVENLVYNGLPKIRATTTKRLFPCSFIHRVRILDEAHLQSWPHECGPYGFCDHGDMSESKISLAQEAQEREQQQQHPSSQDQKSRSVPGVYGRRREFRARAVPGYEPVYHPLDNPQPIYGAEGDTKLAKARVVYMLEQLKPQGVLTLPAQYRLQGDRFVFGGDTLEETYIPHPVIVNDALPVPEQSRLSLIRELDRIGALTQDFHESEPLQDLIDPNLGPRLLQEIDEKFYLKAYERLEDVVTQEKKAYVYPHVSDPVEKANALARDSYQWIPALFKVSADRCNVTILTAVHHTLPRTPENEQLYVDLETVFREMIPQLEAIGVLGHGEATMAEENNEALSTSVHDPELPTIWKKEQTLQVVVKVQKYWMQPNSEYKGHWHVEGASERVCVNATYFYDVDPGLKGGNLRFRHESVVGHDNRLETATEITTEQGTCVVWTNDMVHRVRNITNPATEGKAKTRGFLSFSIIDPRYPLPHYDSPELKLHPDNTWENMESMKRFRAHIRDILGHSVTGWGFYGYGNCGLYKANFVRVPTYTRDEELVEYRLEQLMHTESPSAAIGSQLVIDSSVDNARPLSI